MPMDDDANVLTWHEQVQRKNSLPRADSAPLDEQRPRGKSAPGVPPTGDAPARRRGFSLARHQSVPAMSVGKSRRRRKVTFKNMYAPDVVPPPKVESYDELVFNVAGLFHTMSFLHDPEDWDDPTGSMSSEDDYYDPEPLERSVPLMIAEFLYRSAMFLGYPQGDTPWLPGFREDKKFSGNDVKRWRRLAHFDWEAEEREFQQNHRKPPSLTAFQPGLERKESVESNGHKSVMSTIGASFHMRRQDSAVSVDSMSSSSSMDNQVQSHSGKTKFRSAVSGWIRKHRRQHSKESLPVAEQVSEDESGEKSEEKKKRKHKPVSWLNPPPISSSRDLALLVDIINSCVYCGQFQFRKRDIVRLCNVRI